MGRFKLLLAEAVRSLGANVSTTVAATMTVLIGMFLLGFLIGLATWGFSVSKHYKRELVVKVFFNKDATNKEMNALRARLLTDPRVKSVGVVNPQDALKDVEKHYPVYKTVTLPSNPLGYAFTVQPKRGEDTEAIAKSLTPKPAGVSDVNYGKKTAHRLLAVAKWIDIFFIFAVVILLVSSTVLIANTIRLAIFARRREIEVMKLVGATNWFVRGPFMVEGLMTGIAGALGAIILLLLGKLIVLQHINLIKGSDIHAWPFELTALIILGVGLLVGAAGSGLTIRRFLQV
ncbi:MAG: ABC transporter permease [Actinobacteria bacterium]|jgi:cell division transport system permease protein|nr:MAG: ABC transporter permease [Actinomycetota bacterium]